MALTKSSSNIAFHGTTTRALRGPCPTNSNRQALDWPRPNMYIVPVQVSWRSSYQP
jgi:hypothetical protein